MGAPTDLVGFQSKQLETQVLDPVELGLTSAAIAELKGGEVAENVEILTQVLQGKGTPAQQQVVALNASLALQVGEKVAWGDHQAGVTLAQEILRSEAAWDKLQALVQFLKN